jgi:hypothetical protein
VVVQLHGSVGQIDFYDPIAGNDLAGLTARLLETALLGRAEELQSLGEQNAREWSQLLDRPVRQINPGWSAPADARQRVVTGVDVTGVDVTGVDVTGAGIVVGRLQSWKGPQTLCEAAELLGDRAPKVLWVGRDHPYLSLGQSMANHLAQEHRRVWSSYVIPIGERSRDDVAAMQRAARFVVVPSIWDTFNLVAVESMWASKVVICSEGAGAAELIEHGVNGFRFPVADARSLADLLLLVDRMTEEQRAAIGARARRTIETKLDAQTIAAARLARYAEVKAHGSRRRPSLWGNSAFGARRALAPFGFLEGLPLRPLLRHSLLRAATKLRRSFS